MSMKKLLETFSTESENQDETARPGSRLQQLIEKAKAMPRRKLSVEILVDDLTAHLEFSSLLGSEWSNLTAVATPRPDSEADLLRGYNPEVAAERYPAYAITVDGERVTAEQWVQFWQLTDAAVHIDVAAVLWALNEKMPRDELAQAIAAKRKEDSDGK